MNERRTKEYQEMELTSAKCEKGRMVVKNRWRIRQKKMKNEWFISETLRVLNISCERFFNLNRPITMA